VSALGEGLARLFGRGAAAADIGWREQLRAVIADHGGNITHTARALGVHRTTVQRWNRGAATPGARTQDLLGQAIREATAPRIDTQTLQFQTEGGDGRNRVLSGKGQVRVTDQAARNARAEWVTTGDPEAAALELWKGIKDRFYRDYLGDEDFGTEYDEIDSDYCAVSVTVRA